MVSDLEPHASQILERFCLREIIRLVSGCVANELYYKNKVLCCLENLRK